MTLYLSDNSECTFRYLEGESCLFFHNDNEKNDCVSPKSNQAFERLLQRLQQKDSTLRVLSLCDSTSLSQKDFVYLANALMGNQYIVSVKLSNVQMKDRHCMHLAKAWGTMSCLETLNIESNWLSGIGIEAIAAVAEHHPKLKDIYISNQRMPIGVAAERSLANCLSQNHIITTLGFDFRERFVYSYVDKYLHRNRSIQQKFVASGSNIQIFRPAYPFPIRDIFEVAHDIMYPTADILISDSVEPLMDNTVQKLSFFQMFNQVDYSKEGASTRPSFKLSFLGLSFSNFNKSPRSEHVTAIDHSSDKAPFLSNILGGSINNLTRTTIFQTMPSENISSVDMETVTRFSNATKSSRSTRDTKSTLMSSQFEGKHEQTIAMSKPQNTTQHKIDGTADSTLGKIFGSGKQINTSWGLNTSERNVNSTQIELTLSLESVHNKTSDDIYSSNPMLCSTLTSGNCIRSGHIPSNNEIDMNREKNKTDHINKMGSAFYVNSVKHSSSGKCITPRNNFFVSNSKPCDEASNIQLNFIQSDFVDYNQNRYITPDTITPTLHDNVRQPYRVTSSKDGMHLRLTPTKQQLKGIASLFPMITDD